MADVDEVVPGDVAGGCVDEVVDAGQQVVVGAGVVELAQGLRVAPGDAPGGQGVGDGGEGGEPGAEGEVGADVGGVGAGAQRDELA